MPTLIIDTSTETCLIALSSEDSILAFEAFPHGNQLSQTLLPAIESMVKKECGSPTNLSAIALGIGPGSYTGTRLGVAVAKALAFGLRIPLKPFASPLAFLPDQLGTFAFVMPTRAGHYFALCGTQTPDKIDMKNGSTVDLNTLLALTEAAEYLVTPSGSSPAAALAHLPCYLAAHNLPLLLRSLAHIQPGTSENIPLIYLHSPL